MTGPPIASVPDIALDCTDEELFISLAKMVGGCILPCNVITDVNPYNYAPSNLPDGIWYLICSKENAATKLGFWRVKGEACKLFSNFAITGWRTTLEFFEGQVPHERKTDWVMQEYWITQKEPGENSKVKEAASLCKVFMGGEKGLDHTTQNKSTSLHIACENLIHSTKSIVPKACEDTISGSTSKPAVDKNDEPRNLSVTVEPPNYLVENPPEIDYFSRGDYLELLDLDTPASPSSSSDTSSCLTMSSDECFDSLALLQELDSAINQDSVQKGQNCKFSVSASFRPNELVMVPASPGSFISIEESKPPIQILETDTSLPSSANGHKDEVNIALQNVVRNQKADYRDEGPSNSDDAGTSSGHHLPSREKETKIAKGKMKKIRKKYLCFMPLYFLF